ncbi:MAG: chemotaxis protein CheA [Gemmatimonadaceae bacterium]
MPDFTLDDAIRAAQSVDPLDPETPGRLTAVADALRADASLPAAVRALGTSLSAHLQEVAREPRALQAALAVFRSIVTRLEMRRTLATTATDHSDPTVPSPSTHSVGLNTTRDTEATPPPSSPASPSPATHGTNAPENNVSVPGSATPTPVPAGMLPADAEPGLVADYITECLDLLDGAESALLQLESDPEDMESVNTVFRAVHTIKGTSTYLALEVISRFAHSAETLLVRMRDKEIRCVGGYAGLALQSVDVLTDLIRRVQRETAGEPPEPLPDLDPLVARLKSPENFGISAVERRAAWRVQADLDREAEGRGHGARGADATVRVRTDRLDRLIEMVGELMIAQTLVAQDESLRKIPVAAGPVGEKLNQATKIVRELQSLAMSMRMVPLRATFQKLKRLARDVAHRTGKLVTLECHGEDTEVDRNLVDVIADPLVHMLRNAIDHGIETPVERVSAHKPEVGRITLRASQAGGNVVVELTDDGRGLNRTRILAKAIHLGLVAPNAQLNDASVWQLIFTPGFSTADQLTDVSGRGVGMDVVRNNIESMRGIVDIESTAGQGSRFTIRLPLTLAVTDGMLVRVGAERYVIPTSHIHFSFRPQRAALNTVVGRGEVVVLRDEVLPVLRLHRMLGIEGGLEDPAEGILVVVGDEGTRAALFVDELVGQQQVVVKSLGDGLPPTEGIAGGAILGDGRVGLILDVSALMALLRVTPVALAPGM